MQWYIQLEERTHLGVVRTQRDGPVCTQQYEYLLLQPFCKCEDGAQLQRQHGSLQMQASGCGTEVSGMEKLLIKMKR